MVSKLSSQTAAADPDETVDLNKLIAEIVPDPDTWKMTPNAALGGKRPIDFLNTPQEQALRDIVRAAKQGMVS